MLGVRGNMRLTIVNIIFTLAVFLLSPPSWSNPEDDALVFVKNTGIGNNLERIAIRVAMDTQTYRMINADVGKTAAANLVKKHIKITTRDYQDEWNENLAASYLEYLSAEELNSIYNDKKSSPYLEKFQARQNDVGASMQHRSKNLLQKVVSEAMKNAFTESATSNK